MGADPGLRVVEPGLREGGFGGGVVAEIQAVIRRREEVTVLAVDGVVAVLLGV